MVKYILRESELRTMIENIVAEEVSNILNEGIGSAIGSAIGNTLKYGALGVVAPTMLAGKAFSKANGIVNGNDTVWGTVKDYFGNGNGSSGGSSRKTRSQKQSERYRAGRDVSFEYGRPETVPGWGNRLKLDKKEEIMVPEEVLDDKGKCVQWGSKTGQWGSFGKHYHDEGDRMWQRVFKDKENALIRNCRNDQSKLERLKRKYKRILLDWLKDRDRAYEEYIKTHNKA
jgi:hypothetical protein